MKYLKYLLVLFLIPFIVFAEECDTSKITITSMGQSEITGKTVELEEPEFNGQNIKLNIKMKELNDSITYDMTIKNDSEDDYMIDEDTFKTDSEYIEYTLDIKDDNNVVKAQGTKDVILKVTYKKEVADNLLTGNKYDASNNLKLSLNTSEKEKELDFIVTDIIKNIEDVKNPVTSVTSIKVMTIILLSLAAIIYLTIRNKKRYNKYIVLVLSLVMAPVVYAVCKIDIQVEANIEIEKIRNVDETMTAIADEENSCIIKYEGLVTDEVGKTVNASNVYINKCADRRNVIFGGYCWQIIRTTETKGLKMIYNGKPVDGKCETERESQKAIVQNEEGPNFSGEMLFGDSFDYDLEAGTFTLKDTELATVDIVSLGNYQSKYTCKNTTGTCSKLYYINLSQLGINFIESYTINNTYYYSIARVAYNNSFYYGDYYNNIHSAGFHSSYSLANVGYMYNKHYALRTYPNNKTGLVFSDSFTYDSTNGTYTLTGNKKTITNWDEDYNQLGNKHYTCVQGGETCEFISYVDSIPDKVMHHIDMYDGEDIDDVINNALHADNVNTIDSNAKFFIDEWYKKFFLPYSDKLEDTVFCNDRSIVNYYGFDKNADIFVSSYYYANILEFNHATIKGDLSCVNSTDQFAVSNNKAKLKYPVALATGGEMYLLGENSLRNPTGDYTYSHLMTPALLDLGMYRNTMIGYAGYLDLYKTDAKANLRPVISLKKNNIITSGNGSETDPWIIE